MSTDSEAQTPTSTACFSTSSSPDMTSKSTSIKCVSKCARSRKKSKWEGKLSWEIHELPQESRLRSIRWFQAQILILAVTCNLKSKMKALLFWVTKSSGRNNRRTQIAPYTVLNSLELRTHRAMTRSGNLRSFNRTVRRLNLALIQKEGKHISQREILTRRKLT